MTVVNLADVGLVPGRTVNGVVTDDGQMAVTEVSYPPPGRSDFAAIVHPATYDAMAREFVEQSAPQVTRRDHLRSGEPEGTEAQDERTTPVIPIATARKPRTSKQFAIDIHNANLLIRYDHGESPSSRKYVEIVDTEAKRYIARDPMPSIVVFNSEGVLTTEHVELPGPNCLDTLSSRLKLTDEERVMYRTRREDAAALLAEYAEIRRSELETPT